MRNPLRKTENMRSVKMEKLLDITENPLNKFENVLGKTEKCAR
jgi:hypothetical protein